MVRLVESKLIRIVIQLPIIIMPFTIMDIIFMDTTITTMDIISIIIIMDIFNFKQKNIFKRSFSVLRFEIIALYYDSLFISFNNKK